MLGGLNVLADQFLRFKIAPRWSGEWNVMRERRSGIILQSWLSVVMVWCASVYIFFFSRPSNIPLCVY